MRKNFIVTLIMFLLIVYGSAIFSIPKLTVLQELIGVIIFSDALICFLYLCSTVKE